MKDLQNTYETGAKTFEVNDLVLFACSTRELATMDVKNMTPKQIIESVLNRYQKEFGTRYKLTSDQKRDFLEIFIDDIETE